MLAMHPSIMSITVSTPTLGSPVPRMLCSSDELLYLNNGHSTIDIGAEGPILLCNLQQ